MPNPILEQLAAQGRQNNVPASNPMIQQLLNFKKNYRGDPKQAVMQMLQNGQITEAQLKQAMEQARQLQSLIR